MTQLPPFRLEAHFSKWEFRARYHMTASDAESLSLPDLLAYAAPADREKFDDLWLGYTETFGASDLRDAIASTYDQLSSDQIICFAGAEEGLYVAMQCLLGPDDHAIVLTPNYQSAESVPLSLCHVSGVPLDPARDWALDLDQLRAAIRPNTKLVSINFPHNPTGSILERSVFDGLVSLCRQHGLWLFSDEVYRMIERDESRRLPQAADVYERGISLNVLSKAYGLPGLRIGWIGCQDTKLLSQLERFKHYLSISNSGPSERLAIIGLKARHHILDRNRQLAAENAARLTRFFEGFPELFEWRVPDGSVVGYPRYKGPDGVEAFTERLVEEAGILLLPASIYSSSLGPTPQDRFRIGYGRAGLETGLGVFEAYLKNVAR